MAEQPASPPATTKQIQASLDELTAILRQTPRLEPEAQQALADLVSELGKALNSAAIPSEETVLLASRAAELARNLRRPENQPALATARKRLEEAVLRAEAEHPAATGIAWRLLDALANLGI